MNRPTGPEFLLAASLALSACSSVQQPAVPVPVSFPEPESAGAKLLQSRCSACHAAPAPSVHRADIWPSVVYRMQNRLTMKAYDPLTEQELQTLTEYLQKHAGQESE